MDLARRFVGTVLALAAAVAVAATTPTVSWVRQAGGNGHDKTRGLAPAPEGGVYLTGEFTDTLSFGRHRVTSRGGLDFFIARYDAHGECLWVRQGGGSKTDRGYDVEVDRSGGVYVTGHYESLDAVFGPGAPLPQRGSYDNFVARYEPDGDLAWIKTFGGSGYDFGHSIGVDSENACISTGALVGQVECDGERFGAPDGGSQLYAIRFARSGKLDWLKLSSGSGSNGQGIAVSRDGDSWITGSFGRRFEMNGQTLQSEGGEVGVVRLDSRGQAMWVAQMGGRCNGVGTGVALDGKDGCYVSGMIKGTAQVGGDTVTSAGDYDAIVARFDARGQGLWLRGAGGPETDYGLGITSDGRGGAVLVGELSGRTSFFGEPSTALGRDILLAGFEASGKVAWRRALGGVGDDLGYCVVRTSPGSLYVSGSFAGKTRFDSNELTSAGSNDVLLVKLDEP